MGGLPDAEWYFEHVLANVDPDVPNRRVVGPAAAWQRWWRERVGEAEPFRTAATQGFVLTTRQLSALGVTRSAYRNAVAHVRWSTPARGIVGVVDVRDGGDDNSSGRQLVLRREHALVATAGALVQHGFVVSSRSGAVLHGLPTLVIPPRAELTSPGANGPGPRGRRHRYAAALPAEALTSWFGVPVTTIARTLADVARHDRRDGIIAGDAARRECLVTMSEIEAALDGARGWPGVIQAREVLALTSPLAESPFESLLRLRLHDDGFPPLEPQFWIGNDRVDIAFPGHRLVVEADGRGKYVDDALWEEKRRETRLRRAGWKVERVLWSDLFATWPATSARLRAALYQLHP